MLDPQSLRSAGWSSGARPAGAAAEGGGSPSVVSLYNTVSEVERLAVCDPRQHVWTRNNTQIGVFWLSFVGRQCFRIRGVTINVHQVLNDVVGHLGDGDADVHRENICNQCSTFDVHGTCHWNDS